MLRPGAHVLRRSASELQVGLDPRHAVVLPDSPEVRALLDALAAPTGPRPEQRYDGRTLAALVDSGLLVDLDVLLPLAPAPTADQDVEAVGRPVSRADVAAMAAAAGDRAAGLLQRRATSEVEVATCGSREATSLGEAAVGLLATAGVSARLLPHGLPPAEAAAPSEAAVTGLLVAVGEPPREQVDPWMRAGTPHLLLRLTEGHAVVGPFVLPGETPCLRCLDAHHTDVDPAWPLLVTQYASAVTRPRDDTIPEPVDRTLATLVGAWAARELLSYAEGRVPGTTSATVRLDPHLTALESQTWPRHPACGCTWE